MIQAVYTGFKIDPAVDNFLKKYYKLSEHKNYSALSKKYKKSYYFGWYGIETYKKDLGNLYYEQKTAFKINVAMSYILYKWIDEEDPQAGFILRLYNSSINNNPLFSNPIEVHDEKSLDSFYSESMLKIASISNVEYDDTKWIFYSYVHCEFVIYRTNLTIGNAISLPKHFYNSSNEKNLVKYDHFDENLCFWRCLAAFNGINNSEGGKIDYRRFERPAKELNETFYNKKI